MDLNQWFEKGMLPDKYIKVMNEHKTNLLHIYDHFTLQANDEELATIRAKKLRVIVLTEDWCGDAMLNIPILLRIAEKTDMSVRMLLRDQNLELMDQYLTNGKSRSIPIFIFINDTGHEVAKWGPRAPSIQAFVDQSRAALPDKNATDYDEKFQEMLRFMTSNFRDNTDFWQDVSKNIIETLTN